MAISNVSTSVPSTPDPLSAIASSSAPPVNNGNNRTGQQQSSAVVSISRQGQALSQNGSTSQATQSNQLPNTNNNVHNPATEGREGKLQEASEKPGIQLLETEKNNTPTQGSRVNTYV